MKWIIHNPLMYWKVKNSTHYRGMSVCYVPLYRKWPPLLVIFLQLNYVWGYDFFSFLKWCCISVLLCGIMAILCNVLQRLHIFNLDHIGICNHMIFYILTPCCHCWWNRLYVTLLCYFRIFRMLSWTLIKSAKYLLYNLFMLFQICQRRLQIS